MLPSVDIDLSAIVANYDTLAAACPGAAAAPVVKCNAYGLGMAPVARCLALHRGCRTFFVAYPSEGAALRTALADIADDAEILVFHGVTEATLSILVSSRLTPILNSAEQGRLWKKAGGAAPVAIHVDTGIHRLGASLGDLEALRLLGLNVSLLMSHFARAGEPGAAMNARQARAFSEIRRLFPGVRASLASSGGALLDPGYGCDLTRLGVGLYGSSPFDDPVPALRPVATLTAEVLTVHEAGAGEGVGYGHTFMPDRPARLATVAYGYGDGYHRAASNKGFAWLGGARCPVVGRVSMDLIVLDITGAPLVVAPGDRAEFFGPHVSIDDAAAACGTVGYELLTAIGPRVVRRYLWNGALAGETLTGA